MKNLALGLVCFLVSAAGHAAENGYHLGDQAQVLDDRVMYTIGGGSAAGAPSSLYRPNGLGVGMSWRANMMCGNMNLSNTLQNQLNGATQGFQQIMGNVIQNATQAVMSLPAMIIQRANPGLYELLSNGVLQGRIDFDRSKLTCQAMAAKMADKVDQAGWGALAAFMLLRALNVYGDAPWQLQPTTLQTLMGIFNITKYPPSLLFLLLTLGIGLLLFLPAGN